MKSRDPTTRKRGGHKRLSRPTRLPESVEANVMEYEEVKFIARGSQGMVGLYRRKLDGSLVVQKWIPITLMTNDEKQMASNEVKVLSMLAHPHIIKYHDSFYKEGAIAIVMEYVPGGTLHNYLQMRNGYPMQEKECLNLFGQIVLGINYIHSLNILHRDLKPQNIFLSKDKTIVKIGDFGISKVLSSRSNAESVVGTVNYLSPELCEGKPYNKKNDIWALGCVLYELLSLKKAFDAPSLSEVIMKITNAIVEIKSPPQLSEVTCKLLQCLLRKDPDHRPSSEMLLAHPALMSTFPCLLALGSNLPLPDRKFTSPGCGATTGSG